MMFFTRKTKVLASLVISLCTVFCFTACSADTEPDERLASTAVTETENSKDVQAHTESSATTLNAAGIVAEEIAPNAFLSPSDNSTLTVSRVIDGDTLVILLNGKEEHVRLIGVDSPELGTAAGTQAAAYTSNCLLYQPIELVTDVQERDPYGRLLAYVYLGGQLFNESLVKDGFAAVATYPPNVKYRDLLLVAEQEARKDQRGLWADTAMLMNTVSTETTAQTITSFSESATAKPLSPTTVSSTNTPSPEATKDIDEGQVFVDEQGNGLIKGNINSKTGEKIYHCPGMRSYEKTKIDTSKGERWFKSEREAEKAGWRKARS